MNYTHFFAFSCLFFFFNFVSAQTFHLSGHVKSAENGENVPEVAIYDAKSGQGILSNSEGYYELSFKKWTDILLTFEGVGYEKKQFSLHLSKDTTFDISLKSLMSDSIQIIAEKSNLQKTEMSILHLNAAQIQKMPMVFGQIDIIKAFQLMPGVQMGTEGSTGLYVRGGGPDQNLILLDDVPLYYVNHFGGLFSLFDANVIGDINLIKGGFPARYGGRLSSVMDISMREGNRENLRNGINFGLLSWELYKEGRIGKKHKINYLTSFRTSPIGFLIHSYTTTKSQGKEVASYNFYDFNAKLTYSPSVKDKISLTLYQGNDKIKAFEKLNFDTGGYTTGEGKFEWGNRLASLKWNHIYHEKLSHNSVLGYTQFHYDLTSKGKKVGTLFDFENNLQFSSGVRDFLAKTEWHYTPSIAHDIRAGVNFTWHTFTPGISAFQYKEETNPSQENIDTLLFKNVYHSQEVNLYAEDDWIINSKLSIYGGVHAAFYFTQHKLYGLPQPRIAAKYLLTEKTALKFSYSLMQQYLHLLSNSNVGLPMDLWVPATGKVKPQLAHQVVFGVTQSLFHHVWELSVEGYYKEMRQLIHYKEGSGFISATKGWENMIETNGVGKVWGMEVFLQKKKGKLTGWLGYTLSKNTRQFENINQGKAFPYNYDQRHNISVVGNYTLGKGYSLSANWVYSSGRPLSIVRAYFPALSNNIDPNTNLPTYFSGEYYGEKNSLRMADYHRLDVSIQRVKWSRGREKTFTFGFYNAYNRQNPFMYFYRQEKSTQQTKLYQFSLFPILPFLNYQIRW